MPTINAAGTVPWRRRPDGTLEVALVHRPRYDDWSWAKGKLDKGEAWPVAAARETEEETGLRVSLGIPLPPTTYRVVDQRGRPMTKHVRYWAAEVTGGNGELLHEIDEVAWLDVVSAHDRLDYAHDREQLRAVLRADLAGTLDTFPVAVVRHGRALPRSHWKDGPDADRPLIPEGHEQAVEISDVLAAYGITSLVSSPSARCVATIAPYAARLGLDPILDRGLSEEGFAEKGPRRAARAVRRLLDEGIPSALCSHGPVLPTILETLQSRLDRPSRLVPGSATMIAEAVDLNLDKGEVLVCQVSGLGGHAVVVSAERHAAEA